MHRQLGDFTQAKDYYEGALAIMLKKFGSEHVTVATTYKALGLVHCELGDLNKAKDYHDRALAILPKKRGPENVNVAASYNDLGLVHRQLGDLTQAKDFREGAPPHSPGRVRNKRECSLF